MVSLTLVWRSVSTGRPLWGFAMWLSVRGTRPGLGPDGHVVLFRADPRESEPEPRGASRAEWLRSLVRNGVVPPRPTEKLLDLALRVPRWAVSRVPVPARPAKHKARKRAL